MGIGGMAHGRGIVFTNGTSRVQITDDGHGGYRCKTHRNESNRFVLWVSRIPFLRGLVAFGQIRIMLALILATVLVDFSSLIPGTGAENLDVIASWAGTGILAAVIVTRLFFLKDILRYHGAEHMAINTFESGLALTVENISAAARTHPRCGTMLAIYLILVGIPCALLIPFVSAGFLLTVVVSYELYLNAGKFKYLKGLTAAGLWLQKTLTTAAPESKHMEAARQGLIVLLTGSADNP